MCSIMFNLLIAVNVAQKSRIEASLDRRGLQPRDIRHPKLKPSERLMRPARSQNDNRFGRDSITGFVLGRNI